MQTAKFLLTLVTMVILAACPRGTRKTLVPDVPQNGDAHARSRFSEARAKFLRDGTGEKEFRQIAEDYPDDPIAPFADLYAGIAAIKDRHFDIAQKSLEIAVAKNQDPGLALRAQLFLGIAKNYTGDPAGALTLLRKASSAVENDDERTEYLAALAYATTSASSQPLAALPIFDQLYTQVSATERARDRRPRRAARGLKCATRAPESARTTRSPTAAGRRWRPWQAGSRSSPATRRKGRSCARPRHPRASPSACRGRSARARPPRRSAAAMLNLVGAIVPLGGKTARAARPRSPGSRLAAGVPDGHGVVAIELRGASEPELATAAVEDLARANVIAIVGPVDGASVDAAGARAEALGDAAPEPRDAPRAADVRSLRVPRRPLPPRHARRALAQRALGKGVKSFAILAPESEYRRSVTCTAFIAEVGKGGGTIATKVTYPTKTESFANFAGKLGGSWDALFVPDQAETLALIAPALATAGKVPKPLGYTKKITGGRAILLLSTAEGLTNAFLTAGRHADGALLAPGFYPDDQRPAASSRSWIASPARSAARPARSRPTPTTRPGAHAAAAGASGRAGLAATRSRVASSWA